ncbi:MAG: anthranilate phosphoribosyltransferase [Phycisphaerales bacterium]|nr:anthranilate phosphoribosyltransferase [Phycisphaerales bacterium]
MEIRDALDRLVSGGTLSEPESEALFETLLSGGLDGPQIAAVLALLQRRGPTVDEVVGAARVMRRHVTPVLRPRGTENDALIDTCGTGGAPKTFNVSTASAIVAAASHAPGGARVLVAKHGNRSRTGRGSAEVLAALGVRVDASPAAQSRCLAEAGVCFCFAIHHHPAMQHAIGPRRSLGFPTIFNLLGPLTNPAGARRQLIGVYAEPLVGLLAEALARLGSESAVVAHGADGLDELTTTAPVRLARVVPGKSGAPGVVAMESLDAMDLGLRRASLGELQASSVEDAAEIIRTVLAGESGARRDIVVLNAAAALVVAGAAPDWAEGLALASASIDSGRAAATLAMLARISNDPVD